MLSSLTTTTTITYILPFFSLLSSYLLFTILSIKFHSSIEFSDHRVFCEKFTLKLLSNIDKYFRNVRFSKRYISIRIVSMRIFVFLTLSLTECEIELWLSEWVTNEKKINKVISEVCAWCCSNNTFRYMNVFVSFFFSLLVSNVYIFNEVSNIFRSGKIFIRISISRDSFIRNHMIKPVVFAHIDVKSEKAREKKMRAIRASRTVHFIRYYICVLSRSVIFRFIDNISTVFWADARTISLYKWPNSHLTTHT